MSFEGWQLQNNTVFIKAECHHAFIVPTFDAYWTDILKNFGVVEEQIRIAQEKHGALVGLYAVPSQPDGNALLAKEMRIAREEKRKDGILRSHGFTLFPDKHVNTAQDDTVGTESKSVIEALRHYREIIVNKQDETLSDKEKQSVFYLLQKYIYILGDGDWERGAAKYSKLEEEKHEQEKKDNPVLAKFEALLKSSNPNDRMFAEYISQIESFLPAKDANELQQKIFRDNKILAMLKSNNPTDRVYAEFFLQGGLTLPTKDGNELLQKILRDEIYKSAMQTPVDAGQMIEPPLPVIKDPTNQSLWEILKNNLSISDTDLAKKMNPRMGRQAINRRRKFLEGLGYKVREPKPRKKVSRQKKQLS
jgi:hypothetical protein